MHGKVETEITSDTYTRKKVRYRIHSLGGTGRTVTTPFAYISPARSFFRQIQTTKVVIAKERTKLNVVKERTEALCD